MSSNNFDPDDPVLKERGIELYGQDTLFRRPFTPEQYASLQRLTMGDFPFKMVWDIYCQNLPRVLFIDLWDIEAYLRTHYAPGFSAIDISRVAEIVLSMHGMDTEIADTLWSAFEDEIMANVQAELGVSDDMDSVARTLTSAPYNHAIEVMFAVANIIQRYLVQCRAPIIEYESVYQVHNYQNGILMLKLHEYADLVEAYRDTNHAGSF